MNKKILFTVLFVLISLYGMAQKNLNDYKYIIIPKKFEFSKSDDQYQLNSLTKFLFNKYGYEAYFVDDNLPEDLKNDRCLALTSEISKEKGGIFKTKIKIILKDCFGVIVATSQVGESREKQYDTAYNLAIRDAFVTFRNFDYSYSSKEQSNNNKTEKKKPIKVTTTAKNNTELVAAEEVKTEKAVEVDSNQSSSITPERYYAQSIANGFQIVNSEPKVVMILLTTSAIDVFIVKNENAIVYKKHDKWLYSENDGTTTSEKVLNIKF